MGSDADAERRSAVRLVYLCAWCESVWTPDGWLPDRRRAQEERRISHGLCPGCAASLSPARRSA